MNGIDKNLLKRVKQAYMPPPMYQDPYAMMGMMQGQGGMPPMQGQGGMPMDPYAMMAPPDMGMQQQAPMASPEAQPEAPPPIEVPDLESIMADEIKAEKARKLVSPDDRLMAAEKKIEILTKAVQDLLNMMTKQSSSNDLSDEQVRAYLDAMYYT